MAVAAGRTALPNSFTHQVPRGHTQSTDDGERAGRATSRCDVREESKRRWRNGAPSRVGNAKQFLSQRSGHTGPDRQRTAATCMTSLATDYFFEFFLFFFVSFRFVSRRLAVVVSGASSDVRYRRGVGGPAERCRGRTFRRAVGAPVADPERVRSCKLGQDLRGAARTPRKFTARWPKAKDLPPANLPRPFSFILVHGAHVSPMRRTVAGWLARLFGSGHSGSLLKF